MCPHRQKSNGLKAVELGDSTSETKWVQTYIYTNFGLVLVWGTHS